jgi:hypothetical protein
MHGTVLQGMDRTGVEHVKVYKAKQKTAVIEKQVDAHRLLCRELFHKNVDLHPFVGLSVRRSSNAHSGLIEAPFGTLSLSLSLTSTLTLTLTLGKSGKFKVRFEEEQTDVEGRIELHYKRFLFQENKKLVQ